MNIHIHDPINVKIGYKIRISRTEAGLTQASLGEKMGISHQQIMKYEKGDDNIRAVQLIQIAQITGKPIEFFYDIGMEIELSDKTSRGTETLNIVRALSKLNIKQRNAFINLIRIVATQNPDIMQ